MKRIIVLGGFGFIGKATMGELKSKGYGTLTLSRRNGCDLRNYSEATKKFKEIMPDVIINTAAHVGSLHYVTIHTAEVLDDNMQIILNIYRIVKEICPAAKIINPISNCSYPGNANIHKEEDWWNGPVHKSVWAFANSKRMLQVTSECYHMQHNINSINYFVPNAYGPGDYLDPNKTHAFNGMIIRMLKGKQENQKEFEIWGTGNPTREWVYVKDLAKMLANAVEMDESQIQPINIAQNKAYSIKETAEMIRDAIDYKGTLVFNTKYEDGAPTKILSDALFRIKFPDFVFTEVKQGIIETVNYYKRELGVEK